MADRIQQLVVEGLSRAVAEPTGKPLHGGKSSALFAGSAAAKQAAQHCMDNGLLQVLATHTRGKRVQEICAITEKGIAHLLSQVSPKAVLEELVRAVEARGRHVEDLAASAQSCQATLDSLKTQVEKVLMHLKQPAAASCVPAALNGHGAWKTDALGFLSRWQEAHVNEDCPLPELYRQVTGSGPLTIGQFHDGLRQMHEQGQAYLHPWTGPLYEIPEPACAMLVGHAVVYYASRRP